MTLPDARCCSDRGRLPAHPVGPQSARHEGEGGDSRGRVVGIVHPVLGEGSAAPDHVVDTVTKVSTNYFGAWVLFLNFSIVVVIVCGIGTTSNCGTHRLL